MNKWPQGSLDFYIEIFGFSYLVEVKRGLWQHGRVKKVSNMKKKIEEWGLGLPAFVFVCLLSMGIAAMAFSIPAKAVTPAGSPKIPSIRPSFAILFKIASSLTAIQTP